MMDIFKSKVESRKSKVLRFQTPLHFGEYKESLKNAAQLYKLYCKRVLEGLDAVVTKSNYSQAGLASLQVVAVKGV